MAVIREPRVSYGWVIAAAAFFAVMMWAVFFSYGVFINPLEGEFGWSRTETSGVYSIQLVVFSVSVMLFGRLTDRYGPKLVTALGGVVGGVALLLSGYMNTLPELYVYLGVLAGVGTAAMWIPPAATLARWFSKRRGLALGLSLNGYSIGAIIFPVLIERLITSSGWRSAFITLGVIVAATMVAAGLLLKFPRGVDGPSTALAGDSTKTGPSPTVVTFGEAVRTGLFWLVVAAYSILYLIFTVFIIHIVPLATSSGVPEAVAVITLSAYGVGATAGKVVLGGLGDRIGAMKVMAVSFAIQGVAMAAAVTYPTAAALIMVSAVYGFFADYGWVMMPSVARAYFGTTILGSVTGFFEAAGAGVGGGIGPVAAGAVFDLTHSYYLFFMMMAPIAAAGALISLLAQRRERGLRG